MKRLKTDFNGMFGELLCLSHEDYCLDEDGEQVFLQSGMEVTAFDFDGDAEGNPDDIMASGTVEKSPEWLQCNGSRWALRISSRGVYWQSDLVKKPE